MEVRGPKGPVAVTRDDSGSHAIPPLLGVYEVVVDGKTEARVAGPDVRELDLRPRGVAASSQSGGVGARRAAVDVSGPIALALLALVGVHAWVFRKSVYGNTAQLDALPTIPRVAKVAACISLVLWVGIISAGRWIAYFEPPRAQSSAATPAR